MDIDKKQKITYLYIGGFIVPPIIWFVMGFYVDIFSLSKIFNINVMLPVLLLFGMIAVFIFYNKYMTDIDTALQKGDRKSLITAQKSITHLPRFFLFGLPVFAVLLPISAESNMSGLFTFEFFLEWTFGFSIIFLSSIPFFLQMLIQFEEAVQEIPPSHSFNDLNLDNKYFLISIPNIIGTFLVTVTTYLLIFLKNEGNPDLIYFLFTKSVVIGILVIGMFVLNHYMLRKQILSPIFRINDFMNNVILSGGNINSRISIPNRDEFLSITTNFNKLMDFMKQSVLQIDDTTADMVNATKRLTQATKKHGYTSNKENEIANDIRRNLNQIKNFQDTLLNSSGKNLKTVGKVSNEIFEANKKTGAIIESMQEFTSDIRETMEAAQVGEKSLASMRHNMESLFLVYKDIEEILDFTNDIAEKINLLSLNASIEAARAGELGIGFSVVARQIAQLSEDTKKSSIHIQQLLEKSNEKMELGTDQILMGVQTILALLNGVQGIESEFGRILFSLKEAIKTYTIIERDGESAKEAETTIASLIGSQHEKITALSDLLTNLETFSRTNLDALKDLSTTVEHNLHFASDLQKKISKFQVRNPGTQGDGNSKPAKQAG